MRLRGPCTTAVGSSTRSTRWVTWCWGSRLTNPAWTNWSAKTSSYASVSRYLKGAINMPADFAVVAAQAQIINNKGSVMLQAAQLFNTAKVSDLDLTAGQKTMVKSRI